MRLFTCTNVYSHGWITRMNLVAHYQLTIFTSAPLSTRNRTTSKWPLDAAMCSGLSPSLLSKKGFTSGKREPQGWMQLKTFWRKRYIIFIIHARTTCHAYHQILPFVFTTAPLSTRNRATSKWPLDAALCKGVSQLYRPLRHFGCVYMCQVGQEGSAVLKCSTKHTETNDICYRHACAEHYQAVLFTSALSSTRNRATSKWPFSAAPCKGLSPILFKKVVTRYNIQRWMSFTLPKFMGFVFCVHICSCAHKQSCGLQMANRSCTMQRWVVKSEKKEKFEGNDKLRLGIETHETRD